MKLKFSYRIFGGSIDLFNFNLFHFKLTFQSKQLLNTNGVPSQMVQLAIVRPVLSRNMR